MLFQKAAEDEFSCLTHDFIAYANRNKDMKRFPMKNDMGWEYTYEIKKGIWWKLLSFKGKNSFSVQGVMAVINPKALITGDYIIASREDDLGIVERLHDSEVGKISPLLLKFRECS